MVILSYGLQTETHFHFMAQRLSFIFRDSQGNPRQLFIV